MINVSDIVEGNGKTVSENNLTVSHVIPLGTLVEVNCDYLEYHRTRLFVVKHTRDCDGSPLYSLSAKKNFIEWEGNYISIFGEKQGRFIANSALVTGTDDALIVIA